MRPPGSGGAPPATEQIHREKFQLNMDAQDAQDNQDPTLLHERLAPAMTASGFADV